VADEGALVRTGNVEGEKTEGDDRSDEGGDEGSAEEVAYPSFSGSEGIDASTCGERVDSSGGDRRGSLVSGSDVGRVGAFVGSDARVDEAASVLGNETASE
jgi:hypothetical protein